MKLLKLRYGREYIIAMGDTIDCLSLILQLSKKHGRLLVPVQRHCYNTISSMLPEDAGIELHSLISLHDYDSLSARYEVLDITGIHDNTVTWELDMVTVYKAAGLSYADKEKYCPIRQQVKKVRQLPLPGRPYAFIPEGGSTRTFKIDRKYVNTNLQVIVPPHNAFMLEWAAIIENAAEIHCHATGWQRLIDKLPTKGKLFMHHYARPSVPPDKFPFLKQWVQLL